MKSSFSVDEFIANLPKGERIIVNRLRALVLECLPKAAEKAYHDGVPFYRHNRLICFIWPPSYSWSTKRELYEKRGVTLGFCQGYLMSNDEGLLLKEDRKQVYCMYFRSVNDIKDEQIKPLLFEAGLLDDSFKKKSKRPIR